MESNRTQLALLRNRPLFGFFLLFIALGAVAYYYGAYQLNPPPKVQYSGIQLVIFVGIVTSLAGLWWYGTYAISNYFTQTHLLEMRT